LSISSIQRLILVPLVLLVLGGCGGGSSLETLRRDLGRYPEYSVILQDMDSKGLFFKDYFHRYRLLYNTGDKEKQTGKDGAPELAQKLTDWVKVDKETYDKYQPALGMAIMAKKPDGTIESAIQPPGFQYVGDSRFGQWQTDGGGNQVWAWLATSMVLSEVVDELGDAFEKRGRRIDYRDWQEYKKTTGKGHPYFGRKNEQGKPQFGTQGTTVQKSTKGFFERQQARMAERKESFSNKVEARMGRTKASGGRMAGAGLSGSRSFGRK